MDHATNKDLYKLLGLSRGASQDEIRKAHRSLVREYHPDANPGDPSAEERFKEIQQAYEVLSAPEKKRHYDEKLRASSGRSSSGKPRARTGTRAGEKTAPEANLSDLLNRLADHSRGHKDGSFQLGGEELARLANLLGVDITRISELLGKDITGLSELLAEKIKMNARASFGDARPDEFSVTEEDASGPDTSGMSNKLREKRVKGPKARRKGKRVRGPRERKRRGA